MLARSCVQRRVEVLDRDRGQSLTSAGSMAQRSTALDS